MGKVSSNRRMTPVAWTIVGLGLAIASWFEAAPIGRIAQDMYFLMFVSKI